MTIESSHIAVPGISTRAAGNDELECGLAIERSEEPKRRAARDILRYEGRIRGLARRLEQ